MCALVYEIVCGPRAFTPVFGLTVYATTTVLCAFMTGLGIGSALAPRLVERNRHRIWRLYALLEAGIGICALLIPRGLSAIAGLYGSVGQAGAGVGGRRAWCASLASLLILGPTHDPHGDHPPRHGVRAPGRARRRPGRSALRLEHGGRGLAAACWWASCSWSAAASSVRARSPAAMNLLLAGAALLVSRVHRPEGAGAEPAPHGTGALSQPLLYLLYFLIGVVAFGLELCWLRLLVFYLQASAHSFAILLAVHLSGLGLGALVYARLLARRLRSPVAALRTFVVIELLVGILGAGHPARCPGSWPRRGRC
jgi:spermidine synthase